MKHLVALFILFRFSQSVIHPSLPEHLLTCYRGGGPSIGAPRRLEVFISLLRQLENNSQLDLRLFSTALLRSLRLDGVEQSQNPVETEFVTPYRASSFQFHKYKLLMDLFLPSQNLLEVDEILTSAEKCLLHQVISSTVRQWERGDEDVVCPLTATQRENIVTIGFNESRLISRCPIELGVIQTDWGTISPGTVISAIASAMEAQRVLVSDILNADIFKADIAEPLMSSAKDEWFADIETLDTIATRASPPNTGADISNIWVSTLAGDLAEVVVNQGPRVGSAMQRMVIGSNNNWNDTLLPRNYYLLSQNRTFIDWQFTDSEILAGIDGLILAKYVPNWIEQRRSLRLSQIFDMYYSPEGVSFEPAVRACNRQSLFKDVFNSSQLLTETTRFAHVLSLRQGSVYIPVEEMDRITASAVEAFTNYVSSVLNINQKNCGTSKSLPTVDLIITTDASWKGYDVERFVSWIGRVFELDLERSTIALLHGNTGQWIAPPSQNLTSLFTHIHNFTGEWPNRLNLPNVISQVIQYSQNRSMHEMELKASASLSTVVLVVSPSDTPSNTELERARTLMNTLRTTYFDVYFAYVAQDTTEFQNVNNEYLDYSEFFLTTESTSVGDVISTVDTNLVRGDYIPIRLIGVHCPFNNTEYTQDEYEDFVSPNKVKYYRIHTYYLRQQSLINVQVRNFGQGSLLVCNWRGADTSRSCQTIDDRHVTSFNLTTPCPSPDFCPPVHFSVTGMSTLNICANNECRVPQQIGYYIQHAGLRCLALRGNAMNLKPLQTLIIFLSCLLSLLVK